MSYFLIITIGFLISLLGSIPLGNLNLTALKIAATISQKKAIIFGIGVVLIEMLYLGITCVFVSTIILNSRILLYFNILAVIIFLILAIGCFLDNNEKKSTTIIRNNTFLSGVGLSAVNLLQFPFWLGWVTYLTSHNLFIKDKLIYILFVLGAGIGTFSALLLFIILGLKFSTLIKDNLKKTNLVLGCIFLIMAIIQVFSILKYLK